MRIATWNLRGPERKDGSAHMDSAQAARVADSLKQVDPDVVLLQGVQDWQSCAQLAEALKPANYGVVICSTFRDPTTRQVARDQVAILSKPKPYFTWSEPVQADNGASLAGGYAFAALQSGDRRFGVFSVQCPGGTKAETAPVAADASSAMARQILGQLTTVTNWVANRPQAFAAAGAFPAPRGSGADSASATELLVEAGFGDAVDITAVVRRAARRGNQPTQSTTLDRIFVLPAAAALAAQISPARRSNDSPLVCELELDPTKIALAVAQFAERKSREVSRGVAADPIAVPAAGPLTGYQWITIGCGSAFVLLGCAWIITRRKRSALLRPRQLLRDTATPLSDSPYVIVAPRSTTASDDPFHSQPLVQVETSGSTQTHSNLPAPLPHATLQGTGADQEALRSSLLANMTDWLKQKLVSKLLRDREDLLRTQQAATLKTLEVHQRLERIEARLREQDRAYEARLADLTRELATAREDNRELIRARILQVRTEMESARARMLSQTGPEMEG